MKKARDEIEMQSTKSKSQSGSRSTFVVALPFGGKYDAEFRTLDTIHWTLNTEHWAACVYTWWGNFLSGRLGLSRLRKFLFLLSTVSWRNIIVSFRLSEHNWIKLHLINWLVHNYSDDITVINWRCSWHSDVQINFQLDRAQHLAAIETNFQFFGELCLRVRQK